MRLFGWIAQTRPLVAILTDGSGSTGVSRIDISGELIGRLGGEIVMAGRFAEPDLYELIRSGDAEPLAAVVADLAALLQVEGSDLIVSDADEGYHPGHDLCTPIAACAAALCHTSPRHCEYRVVGDSRACSAHASLLALDDTTLSEKIDTARRYAAESGATLSAEVAFMFDAYGEESFRYEYLFPAGSEGPQLHDGLRYYEKRGEERVREGRYREVLRHATHVEPLVAALRRHSNLKAA
ncbi:MAG: hypothetical protein ABI846_10215 [Rudaea sp.]